MLLACFYYAAAMQSSAKHSTVITFCLIHTDVVLK